MFGSRSQFLNDINKLIFELRGNSLADSVSLNVELNTKKGYKWLNTVFNEVIVKSLLQHGNNEFTGFTDNAIFSDLTGNVIMDILKNIRTISIFIVTVGIQDMPCGGYCKQ